MGSVADSTRLFAWNEGRRIVDIGIFAEQLFCKCCSSSLDLRHTEREERIGFASVLYVACGCGTINDVHTDSHEKTGDGRFAHSVHVQGTVDMLLYGDGRQHIVNFLAALDIPVPHPHESNNLPTAANEMFPSDPVCSRQNTTDSKPFLSTVTSSSAPSLSLSVPLQERTNERANNTLFHKDKRLAGHDEGQASLPTGSRRSKRVTRQKANLRKHKAESTNFEMDTEHNASSSPSHHKVFQLAPPAQTSVEESAGSMDEDYQEDFGDEAHEVDMKERHALESHKIVFRCPVCSKNLPSARGLLVHLSRLHQRNDVLAQDHKIDLSSELAEKTDSPATVLERPVPPLTSSCTTGKRGKKTQMQPVVLLKCRACFEKFEKRTDLMAHRKSAHPRASEYQCNICSEILPNAFRLKKHKRAFHPKGSKRVFTCEICSVQFSHLCLLKMHSRKHSGERPFKCHYCDQTFLRGSNRAAHIRRHHVQHRKYLCETCGMGFFEKKELRDHERMHTGEKPFACQFCSRAFARDSTLRVHVRQHSGERPYQCEKCGASFVQRISWKNHRKAKHPEKSTLSSSSTQQAFLQSPPQ